MTDDFMILYDYEFFCGGAFSGFFLCKRGRFHESSKCFPRSSAPKREADGFTEDEQQAIRDFRRHTPW